MAHTTIRGSTRGVRIAAAVSLAMAVAAVSAGCGGSTPSPPTAHVERGTVATKVSASGALAAVTSQNLGFAKAGQLAELDVKVGDVVRPGQVLAREDPFGLQQVLNQQQAQLNNLQAQLDKVVRVPNVEGDQRTLDQAKRVVDATERNVDAELKADESAIDQAQRQVDFDKRQVNMIEQEFRGGAGTCPGSSTPDVGSTLTGQGQSSGSGGLLSSLSKRSGTPTSPDTDSNQTPYCASLVSAKATLIKDQAALDAAKHKRDTDKTQGDISIQQAKQNVVTAQNSLETDRAGRGPDIDAAAASVAAQRAVVASAQRDVDNTILYAPVGGTVSAINGAVGEWLNAGGGTSSLAPGTDASIPGVGAAATSDQSSASTALSATRPGGAAFVVLNNVNSFQVVVPFEESDAAKVQPNQKVQVTFDAIPDLERDGTVLAVAPNGVNISGVTNYYATILLTQTDPRLHSGLTAETGVMVQEVDNVLTVPNSAVIKQGGKSFVNVPGPDGKPVQREFQPGMVGDDNTQVLSGLTEGQVIYLPQAQVSGSTAPSGGRGGGGRGGGG